MVISTPITTERTHWRDMGLSEIHRTWGFTPALDLDFLEYYNGEPVALIEYVKAMGRAKDAGSANMRALIALGNRAEVPVFAVRYASDFSWFLVEALNKVAYRKLPSYPRLTQIEYVEFLHKLRGIAVPDDVRQRITGTLAP